MDADKARQLLNDERRRIEAALEGVDEDLQSQRDSLSELSFADQHPGDVATETFEREKDFSLSEGFRAQLEEIDAALARVDEGTYGRCQTCGKDIPDDRLEAVPATRYDLEHQADHDRV